MAKRKMDALDAEQQKELNAATQLSAIKIAMEAMQKNYLEESYKIGKICYDIIMNPDIYGNYSIMSIAKVLTNNMKLKGLRSDTWNPMLRGCTNVSQYLCSCYRMVACFTDEQMTTLKTLRHTRSGNPPSWSHVIAVTRTAIPDSKRIPILRKAMKEGMDGAELSRYIAETYPSSGAPYTKKRAHRMYAPGAPTLRNMRAHVEPLVNRVREVWSPEEMQKTVESLYAGDTERDDFAVTMESVNQLRLLTQQLHRFMSTKLDEFDHAPAKKSSKVAVDA